MERFDLALREERRREPDGAWRVIFDKGCPVCDCEKKAT